MIEIVRDPEPLAPQGVSLSIARLRVTEARRWRREQLKAIETAIENYVAADRQLARAQDTLRLAEASLPGFAIAKSSRA